MSVTDRAALPREIGGFPRRARVDMLEPTERAIFEAQSAVEGMPADERLTRASVLLGRARELVADYLEGVDLVADPVEAENVLLRTLLTDAHTAMGSAGHDLAAMAGRIAEKFRR